MRKITLSLGILLAVALAGAPGEQAAAASGPINYAGRTWDLDGSLKKSAKGIGAETVKGTSSASFGEADFLLTDVEGDVLAGTYVSDDKGKAELTPDNGSLLAYITAKLETALAAGGLPGTVGEIVLTDVQGKAKATSVATGLNLTLDIKVKADVSLLVDEDVVIVKVQLQNKGKGLLVTPVAGTSWIVPLATKLKLKGVGSLSGEDSLALLFGPSIDEGLDDGEFLAAFENGDTIVGFFSTDGKTNVFLEPNDGITPGIEAAVKTLVESELGGTLTNIFIEILDGRVKVKVKHGLSIAFDLGLEIFASGDLDGEPGGADGSWSTKGKEGVPIE